MFDAPRLTWPRKRASANGILRLVALLSATLIIFALATIAASQTRPGSGNAAQTIGAKAALILDEMSPATVVRVAAAKSIDSSQTAGGMTVYLGVVPAADVKGQGTTRAGVPSRSHAYHIVAAVFDAASGARVSDASVSARVSGLTLWGPEKRLRPIDIADTITYGGFVRLPGADLYTIRLTIQRPGQVRPVLFEFKYDHRY